MLFNRPFIRQVERRFLVTVIFVVAAVFVAVEWGLNVNQGVTLDWDEIVWIPVALRYVACLTAGHFALHYWQPRANQYILPLIGLLGGISLMMMYRLPTPDEWDATTYTFTYATRNMAYVERQAMFLNMSILVIVVTTVMRFDIIALLSRFRGLILLTGLGLLIATAVSGVVSADGAQVSLNLFLVQFQPAELMKLILVIYLASYLEEVHFDLNRFTYNYGIAMPKFANYIIPLVLLMGISLIVLLLMSDMGVALILLLIFPVMVFVALTRQTAYSLILTAAFLCGMGYLAWGQLVAFIPTQALEAWQEPGVVLPETMSEQVWLNIAKAEYRLDTWRDPWGVCTEENACAPSYQTLQGLYAISSGGLFGMLPGQAPMELIRIPASDTDMIFAALVQEWGLIGGVFILLVYWALLHQGFVISRRQHDLFHSYLAVGIVTIFALQIFIIIGGTLNLLPLTGITVPFLSRGGTSLLVNAFMIGLLLRLSTTSSRIGVGMELERNIGVVQKVYAFGFVLLGIALFFWTIWQASALHPAFPQFDDLSGNPVARQWQTVWLSRVDRGRIVAADGSILARDIPSGREYPMGSLVHVLGQADSIGLGISGLEYTYNETLLGRGRYDLQTLWARQRDGEWQGNDVHLTIDPRWQGVANDALNLHPGAGAIVVLDADSGAVLAMVSHPLYNPNDVFDTERAAALNSNIYTPLLNRATEGLYPPGSTFKTVTAVAALENNLSAPDSVYDYTRDLWYTDDAGRLCHKQWIGSGEVPSCNSPLQIMTLTEGYAWSDNILFANLAEKLGGVQLWNAASRFGFHQELPFDLPTAASQLSGDVNWLDDPAQLAMTGFGQSQTEATPLQMALVAAAIGNREGEIPQPYVVADVLTPDGRSLDRTRPQVWQRAMDDRTAEAMADMMVTTVTDGWGYQAAVDGLTVGGKTGTAEWARTPLGAEPHSWFIGFADLPDGETVAFAVIAEEGGDGSQTAAPLTAYMLSQFLLR